LASGLEEEEKSARRIRLQITVQRFAMVQDSSSDLACMRNARGQEKTSEMAPNSGRDFGWGDGG
jgi:hypothetical protein